MRFFTGYLIMRRCFVFTDTLVAATLVVTATRAFDTLFQKGIFEKDYCKFHRATVVLRFLADKNLQPQGGRSILNIVREYPTDSLVLCPNGIFVQQK